MRLIWGLLCLAGALAMAVLGAVGWLTGWWVWVVVAVLAGFGAFGIYEARKGWCAVRAMGINTKY